MRVSKEIAKIIYNTLIECCTEDGDRFDKYDSILNRIRSQKTFNLKKEDVALIREGFDKVDDFENKEIEDKLAELREHISYLEDEYDDNVKNREKALAAISKVKPKRNPKIYLVKTKKKESNGY